VSTFFYYVLFLLLYWELLYVLLGIKPIVDLFLSFVESFSQLHREFDKPMIFSIFHAHCLMDHVLPFELYNFLCLQMLATLPLQS
jgi:hypothetical protein